MKASNIGNTTSLATRVGVLSDSHGEAARTKHAVETLEKLGATVFIHCGDFETIECLDPLAGLNAHIVFGNCDDPGELAEYAKTIGIEVHHPVGELIVDGRKLAFTHGDRSVDITTGLSTSPDWLFHGHSHEFGERLSAATRVVNPGALHRAGVFTVALVEPSTGIRKFIPIQ